MFKKDDILIGIMSDYKGRKFRVLEAFDMMCRVEPMDDFNIWTPYIGCEFFELDKETLRDKKLNELGI